MPHVAGSSRTAETLTSAGLAGATAVVCVQHDDLYTLETALLTRQLREDVRVVVQFGNPAVGRALTQVGVMVLDVDQRQQRPETRPRDRRQVSW